MRPRETRQKVLIRARVKTGDGWHDACIVDLSRRGAGLQAASAPPRGTYVEVRRGFHVIVARVVWSRGHRFGVATQDDLPVDSIAVDRAPPAKTRSFEGRSADRRLLPRAARERAETSRRWGQRLQFLTAVLGGAVAAMIAGAEVRETLAAPLADVSAALDR